MEIGNAVPSYRLLLVLACFAFAIFPARGSSVTFRLEPANLDQGGIVFDIKSERVQDDDIRFHVVITAKDGHLPEGGSGSVGFIDMSHGWASMPGFNLDLKGGRKEGASLHFDFTIPAELLASPRLFFVFGYDPVPNMPAVNLYYARLQDFRHS